MAITQAQLEARYTVSTVRDVADDIGDESAVAARIAEAIGDATELYYAICRKGFGSKERCDAMIDADRLVRNSVMAIAMDELAGRRKEFYDLNGKTLWAAQREKAIKTLREIAAAALRPGGEEAAGVGANSIAAPVVPNVSTRDYPFVFGAPKGQRGGTGGF